MLMMGEMKLLLKRMGLLVVVTGQLERVLTPDSLRKVSIESEQNFIKNLVVILVLVVESLMDKRMDLISLQDL